MLEGRDLLAADFDVLANTACTTAVTTAADTQNADDGENSLREAILCSNTMPGRDTISFNIPGPGPHSIILSSGLPTIDDAAFIDGLSQSGAGCSDQFPTLRIELNGASAGVGSNGLTVAGGNTEIRGLVINRFSNHGIALQNLGGNVVQCNFVGLDTDGFLDLGNGGHGVFVDNSPDNLIGGASHATRNVISGNERAGVSIAGSQATGNRVHGNFVGTIVFGNQPLGNSEGVEIYNASDNEIGSETIIPGVAPGNVISGNTGNGVQIASGVLAGAFNNRVFGNVIGLNRVGIDRIPNGGHGVAILDAFDNLVGRDDRIEARNTISANQGAGVFILDGLEPAPATGNQISGNHIGAGNIPDAPHANTLGGIRIEAANNRIDGNLIAFNSEVTGNTGVAISGDASTGNSISRNSMLQNVGLGINLLGGTQNANGVTVNDPDDLDIGPNDLLNFPVFDSVSISGRTLTLTGFARPDSIIELFIAAPDPSGFGEGRQRIATFTEGSPEDTDTTTGTYGPGPVNGLSQGSDTTNRFRFAVPTPTEIAHGTILTATATDANGNTSEFSGNIAVTGGLDFGDAPDSYKTTSASNGPRHTPGPPFLGAGPDIEADGQPSTNALGDDAVGSGDDEDGVVLRDLLVGAAVPITVVSSANVARLVGFVDFNIDGDFADFGERVFDRIRLLKGSNDLSIRVPANATPGDTFARFRLSFSDFVSDEGLVFGGEVEDYAVRIVADPPPCTLVVTTRLDVVNAADDVNSLREAILCSNSVAGKDTISFNIPGGGPHDIVLQSELPTVTDPAIIDATTQAGTICGVAPRIRVDISGRFAGFNSNGLTVTAGDTTIRGFSINQFGGSGIVLRNAGGNLVECNLIGLALVGDVDVGNASDGILIDNSPNNLIGGDSVAARNVISGNDEAGISIVGRQATGNRVLGNFIGTNASGTGTNVDGTVGLGNAGGGVRIEAPSNVVERNLIAFNAPTVFEPGVAVSGDSNRGNRITKNSMFMNSGLGIDLFGGMQGTAGVTLNDPDDADNGPNDLLNFPILVAATVVSGDLTLNGFARPGSIVEVFIAEPDPSGFGEGRTLIATLTEGTISDLDTTVGSYGPGAINGLNQGTDTTNRFTFVVPLPTGVSNGTVLTATATDAQGSTSEFSGNVSVVELGASISGLKFVDANGNGIRDGQETGQDGVTIFLDEDGDGLFDSSAETAITTALDDPTTPQVNEAGTYRFADLQPAVYSVCEVTPPNTTRTLPAGPSPCFAVTVIRGEQRENVNFGNLPVDPDANNTLSGFVYADVNDNGIKDGAEIGLPNVTLTLTGPVTRTTTTDASGAYRFVDLPSGIYTLSESQPSAFIDGRETTGNPKLGSVAADAFTDILLAGNVNVVDYNFGERGLIAELISKRLYFASSPEAAELVQGRHVRGEGEWISIRATESGFLHASASTPSAALELYTPLLLPLMLGIPGQSLVVPVAEGESMILFVRADEPTVAIDVRILEAVDRRSGDLERLFNTQIPADASGDGIVSPLDALLIINELNHRRHSISQGNAQGRSIWSAQVPYYDTNNDGYISSIDALVVINALNLMTSQNEPEGEAFWVDAPSANRPPWIPRIPARSSSGGRRLQGEVLPAAGERPSTAIAGSTVVCHNDPIPIITSVSDEDATVVDIALDEALDELIEFIEGR